ncbi:hypothetical protein XANCAGTX0491_001166 [Xanthoria calcicola]
MMKLRPVIPPAPKPLNARAAMKKGMLGAHPQPALASPKTPAASSIGPGCYLLMNGPEVRLLASCTFAPEDIGDAS